MLQQRVERRREIFEHYVRELSDPPELCWMEEPAGHRGTRWLSAFTLRLPQASRRRDALLDFLERHNVEARPVWKPMHLQPLYADCRYFEHAPGHDVSRELFEGGVCLPSGSNMEPQQLEHVCELLRRGLRLATGLR